ncbi:hypothetical protein B0T14DRAFT_565813 [Immersiella caudata]|uniref:Uncharacterized protein n=1 Tax=Immersiella caudata TaxID=314043 RepID=A0AA40BYS6_9PEZI|nr:hypothetical protein B0T14DRAFT_565813 [Immersiella caudata]
MSTARGKPAPDIFSVALQGINTTLPPGEKAISPDDCLVFEDSRGGREAGWDESVLGATSGSEGAFRWEGEVLAGRTGIVPFGEEDQLGEVGDGWAEEIGSLEEFDYGKYGIVV